MPLDRTLKRRFFGRIWRAIGALPRFRYPDPKKIKLDAGNSRIFLPKLGWLRYRNSRTVVGEVLRRESRRRE